MIANYFRRVWKISTRPTEFFQELTSTDRKVGISTPLAFALVTHWIGSALEFVWQLLIGGVIGNYVSQMIDIASDVAEVDNPGRGTVLLEARDRLLAWFWGAGPVIADPFITLASILFTAFFVFVGARLLVTPGKRGAPTEINFDSALRIVCYGLTPSLLAGLPIFGSLLAFVCVAIVTVIGAREVYRVSTLRAIGIGLFPKLLLLAIILSFLFLGFLFVLKAVTTFI